MEKEKRKIDWATMLIPFAIVVAFMALFMIFPDKSKMTVDSLREFFGDTIGLYYPVLAIGSVICALYVAMTPKYGHIRLGNNTTPAYSDFKWGTMIFTSTMAADIMFYSLIEWALYGGGAARPGSRRHRNVGRNFYALSLGPARMGFLCHSCRMFRIYDAYKKT